MMAALDAWSPELGLRSEAKFMQGFVGCRAYG